MKKPSGATASRTEPSPRRLRSATLAKRSAANRHVIHQSRAPVADRENATLLNAGAARKKRKTGNTDVTKSALSSSVEGQEKPKSILTERDASKANTEGDPTQAVAGESKEEVHAEPTISATPGIRVLTHDVPTLEDSKSSPADVTARRNVIAAQESNAELEADVDLSVLFDFDGLPAWNESKHPDPSPASNNLCFSGECSCQFKSVNDRIGHLSDVPNDIVFNKRALIADNPSNFPWTAFKKEAKGQGRPFLYDKPTLFRITGQVWQSDASCVDVSLLLQ